MPDDAAILLLSARQKPRHIFKGQQRDIEGIAKTHKSCPFYRAINVQDSGQECRLVCHNADWLAIEAREPHNEILGIVLVHFEKVAVINYGVDYVLYVVRLVRL